MKYFILLLFLLTASFMNANIIVYGPYAYELMWIDNEWYLELINVGVFWPTLEECYLECNQGFTYFNAISFPSNYYTVVTVEDIIIPFELNPGYDEIILGWDGSELGPSCYIYYGEDLYSMAPLNGESLVRKLFANPFVPMASYLYCRDNSPTMGQPNDDIGFTGIFSGSVVNEQGLPLAGAVIEYYPWDGEYQIITDINGEFSKEMYTVRYDILVKFEEITYIDTMICVAPDSITIQNFVIPITQTWPSLAILANAKISNFPNPFNPSTTIRFSIPLPLDDVHIEIFNSKGQKVEILECNDITPNKLAEVTWNGRNSNGKSVASGVYYARVIGDGLLLKECKMLLLK
ncbi:MAG: FlgD immunoglobulin-like domain containing protein [Candidatus Cloacimonadales bacterium]|nr:FlgD immunoglobulin-like domain containing protein [Candidatus Cloacimonadales bacterium]